METNRSFRWFNCVATLLLLACSKSGTTTPTGEQPQTNTFAGTYPTVVSITQNACGAVTVMDMPTVVTHNKTTAAINLAHAGTNYAGTVNTDSTFTTTPTNVNVGDGNNYVITIAGKFGVGTFTALVTLDRTTTATGAMCRYIVRWIGTRNVQV